MKKLTGVLAIAILPLIFIYVTLIYLSYPRFIDVLPVLLFNLVVVGIAIAQIKQYLKE